MSDATTNAARSLAQRMIRERLTLADAVKMIEDAYLKEVIFQASSIVQASRMADVHRNTIHKWLKERKDLQ